MKKTYVLRLFQNFSFWKSFLRFIVCAGFNTPPFRAFLKVFNPASNSLPKQHTSSFRARLLIGKIGFKDDFSRAFSETNRVLEKALLVILMCVAIPSMAQTAGSASTGFDMTGFPQWTKDLRRAEIVAFGSFPFSFFLTSFTIDTVRLFGNSFDMRYAPWPFKAAGAVNMTRQEQSLTIGIAAGISVLIALIDYFIVLDQRNRQSVKAPLPPEPPIIIRSQLTQKPAALTLGLSLKME